MRREAGFRARGWVVERTHGWMNRFRRIPVRPEKLAGTYPAMLYLACALITRLRCRPIEIGSKGGCRDARITIAAARQITPKDDDFIRDRDGGF